MQSSLNLNLKKSENHSFVRFKSAYKFSLLLVGIIVFCCSSLNAQQIEVEQSSKTGKVVQYIPALTYNSDLGIIGAGMISTFDYGNGSSKPYDRYTRILGAISTKGFATINFFHDQVQAFNSDWRIITAINGGRFFDNNYFGMGNDRSFDQVLWSERGYNFYDSYDGTIDITARYPLKKRLQITDPLFDIYARGITQYQIGYANEGTLADIERPNGFKGGFINQLGIGIIYDSRDNELATENGSRLELEFSAAPKFLGSNWSNQSIYFQYRVFRKLPIWLNPVFGLQFYQLHRFGDVPFWYKPSLGGDRLLRGYVINRFRGQGASLLTAELRAWIFQPKNRSIKLGLQGFYSLGRVFEEGDRSISFFEDYHLTYGGGIAIGFDQSDLILRIDYGQSTEIGRLYVTVGYAF